ncbi:polysaccharide deacetylase family protein [Nocardiopsis eucommiae]|uniref:polysaccharide deacetylase family protein n=1 Tax=Nocardiopsis eucommiae TaxID=2831970 RepID=UPI003D728C07
MASRRVGPGRTVPPPRPVRAHPFRAGVALLLALPLAACGTGTTGVDGGDPLRLTVLADAAGDGVGEWRGDAGDFTGHPYEPEGVEVSVAYPEFEGAGDFAEGLAARVDQEVRDFRAGTRDPVRLDVAWELVAAGDGVLGVRLVRTEEDMHGLREGHATYWYDARERSVSSSTELLRGQEELVRLNALAREELADDEHVDPDALHPVLRTYDSIGFNSSGDLVVEFDDGHLSPIVDGHVPDSSPGRRAVVVEHERAAPLLSDLGARAREAALVEEPDLELPPGRPDDAEVGPPPGVVNAGDPGVDCQDGETRCVALTFDDGPVEATPRLLDLLAEEEVTASFFLNGGPALTRPSVLRRAYAEGHEIASHGDEHEHMNRMDPDRLAAQTAAVSAMVRRQTGFTVEQFRPPFGATNDAVHEEIAAQGMAEVAWTVDSRDWEGHGREEIVETVLDGVEPGAVVLLHDPRPATLAAVPEIVERLREKDYVFVTSSQALGGTEPGKVYPPDWDGDW